MKRPLLFINFGRDFWRRRRGFRLIAIIAPFPEAEQIPGELTAALFNIEVVFTTRFPFVGWHIYAPRRDDPARIGWCERQWRRS